MAATLNSNALVDLDSFKTYVKVPLATTTEDDSLRDVINEASALIESYCNRKFREESVSEVRDGGRTPEILLYQWPVTSISSVAIDSQRLFPVSSQLDSSAYTIGKNEKGEGYTVELYDQVFPRGRKNVQVSYTYGYAAFSDVPADLQLACKRTGAYYWRLQQNEAFYEVQKTKGNENLTIIDGIPMSATQILANYVRLEMLAPPDSVRNL
jgi:hypothetical protein